MSTLKECFCIGFAVAAVVVGVTVAIAAVEYVMPGSFPLEGQDQ